MPCLNEDAINNHIRRTETHGQIGETPQNAPGVARHPAPDKVGE
ncbi:hypothetical protein [Mycolicibacterium porcinum]|uniref:Transposase n=1 Tax=Mycolicibacterium porcinum TaxID=39693 RepID=A0ABV3VCU9_9MYCO